MRKLFKSVMIGSAVVAIPLTIVTVVMAGFLALDTFNGHGNPWTPLMIALGPILVIVPVVACLSVVIGPPFHFVIRRTQYASDLAYSLAGGFVGFAVLALPFVLDGTYEGAWMAPLGLVSGAATGHAWWRSGVSERDRKRSVCYRKLDRRKQPSLNAAGKRQLPTTMRRSPSGLRTAASV